MSRKHKFQIQRDLNYPKWKKAPGMTKNNYNKDNSNVHQINSTDISRASWLLQQLYFSQLVHQILHLRDRKMRLRLPSRAKENESKHQVSVQTISVIIRETYT